MPSNQFPEPTGDTSEISFNAEDVDFKLEHETATINWLKKTIEQEGKQLRLLNFIFCSDQYLHQLNVGYLGHDTFTDVITFHYAEPPLIEGEVFISIERVRENAAEFKVPFIQELRRVIVHGVLHLCGYGDKTLEESEMMRQKENEALMLFKE